MSERSDESTHENDVEQPNIRLSEHVKEKLRQRRATTTTTPLSTASDDVFLSNEDEEEEEESESTPHWPLKRDNTFTTFQIQPTRRTPVESQPFVLPERRSTLKPEKEEEEICFECQRRDELLQQTRQRAAQMETQNRKLVEQLRVAVHWNRQFDEENYRMKVRLNHLHNQLRQYQSNFDALKKNLQVKNGVDHVQRLRQEVHQYNQMIAAKREEEYRKYNFFPHSRR